MARLFPLEITDADVAAMLTTLDSKTPYTHTDESNGEVLACFDCDTPAIGLCVKLANREYDATARRGLEEAIVLLPRFHARVAKMIAPDPSPLDDIELLSVEADGDEVVLLCGCVSVNAQPDYFFSKACHGGPHQPVAFSPEWRTDTVLALARQMFGTSEFGAMPILADALQDAGCVSADILNHCREPRKHEYGCWVVDLVLGRE